MPRAYLEVRGAEQKQQLFLILLEQPVLELLGQLARKFQIIMGQEKKKKKTQSDKDCSALTSSARQEALRRTGVGLCLAYCFSFSWT